MYTKAKSCIKINDSCMSDFFKCNQGVRQGENLSPLLFKHFLNDMKDFVRKSFNGSTMVSNLINGKLQTNDVCLFLKLYLLLYADDTIIMAESATELQDCLNAVSHYCKLWSLKINTTKTKVLIFSKGKTRKIPTFSFNGTNLDVCFDYVYLGVNMNYNGRFVFAKQRQYVHRKLCIV